MIPNHILVLGAPKTGKLRLAQHIVAKNTTSSEDEFPGINDDSHSGLIVKTSINTKYYTTKLNVLVDEYPEQRPEGLVITDEAKLVALKEWAVEFQGAECTEVREVVEGLIFCINIKDDPLEYVEKCLAVVEEIKRSIDDGFLVVVGTNTADESKQEEVEDLVISFGFEYANWSEEGKNEYHEYIGKDRVTEILHTHDWTEKELVYDYEKSKRGKAADMTEGLLEQFNAEDDESEVNTKEGAPAIDLEDIFQKLQLAKENVQHLTPDQRESYVNKVIAEVIDFI